MGWGSAVRKVVEEPAPASDIVPIDVDWARLVSLDFETYYDDDYTLRKLSTSEYIRDPRFEALMVGIKIGKRVSKLVPGPKVAEELRKIDWKTHDLLAHHAQFDGFILSHHYGIQPRFIYCSLSMARGLYSNDIGAGLDEVSKYLGRRGKAETGTEDFKGLSFKQLFADKLKWANASKYCLQDVDEMYGCFTDMVSLMPADEMRIIDMTCRLFTDPVLEVDIPRVQAELTRELQAKEDLLLQCVGKKAEQVKRVLNISNDAKKLAKKAYQGMTAREIMLEEARKEISSNESFADLLRAEGINSPMKISPAYFKHRDETKKYAYAFSKTDLEFTALQEHPSKRVRDLVECRLSIKSTINETRAGRFLEAGKDGMKLPVYLRYYGAHTGRWSGGNKMNMQNLQRGSELRKSIKAPKGHVIVVVDSGQIEARVNAWLWGQEDLLEGFRKADRKEDRDVYCKFADTIYGREITKADELERFVGKIAVLGLGYQMGAPKFQNTLALGTMGPAVYLELNTCHQIVTAYRRKNHAIARGWQKCQSIIEDMAVGRTGSWKCISWGKNTIYLPNGMTLKYPNLRQKLGGEFPEWVYDRKGEPAKIYGGLLCENIVQALARIIVGWQILKIAPKYRPVMTTHDELAALAKTAQGATAYKFMHKVFSTPPSWCDDIPLNADGGFDVIYSK